MSGLREYFARLARYNYLVNRQLMEAAGQLSDEEYFKHRFSSFGSIHKTLNHILLGDRLWIGRLTDQPTGITSVSQILCEDRASMTAARLAEDERIEKFVDGLSEEFLGSTLRYTNMAGEPFADPVAMLLQHMFNHQTHHRGQIHVMLGETGVKPYFDMVRFLRKPL